jgi:chitodextrinase
VRLNITTPTQNTNAAARLYEFEVYGAAATPTPTATSGGDPAWASNTAYAVGDRVVYGGLNYECTQAHTSLVGWEPPNAPSLWRLI